MVPASVRLYEVGDEVFDGGKRLAHGGGTAVARLNGRWHFELAEANRLNPGCGSVAMMPSSIPRLYEVQSGRMVFASGPRSGDRPLRVHHHGDRMTISSTESTLASRLASVRERVENAATAVGRDPASVTIIGVTKTVGRADVDEA